LKVGNTPGVGWPPSPASTNFKLQIPCYRLLESVPIKRTHERLQSRADQPGSLAGRPPPGSTGLWLLHPTSSCQVHYRGDTYFGGTAIFLVVS
jgi:hypothetical protein